MQKVMGRRDCGIVGKGKGERGKGKGERGV